MSKLALSIALVLVLASGFVLGFGVHSVFETPGAKSGVNPSSIAARSVRSQPAALERPSPPRPLTQEELVRAREAAQNLRDILKLTGYARVSALAARLATLESESAPEVGRLLKESTLALGQVETLLLVHFWARYEPEEAFGWASHKADSAIAQNARAAVVESWAEWDPRRAEATVARVLQHVGGADGLALMRALHAGLVRGWFKSGRPGLIDQIRGLGQGFEQQFELSVLAAERVHRDGAAALVEWLEALPDDDPNFKWLAYLRSAGEIWEADPELAMAWCERVCDGPYGKNLPAKIARRWAHKDGPGVFDWLAKRPAGKSRDSAVQDAFSGWRQTDPKSLLRWIDARGVDGVEPWFLPAVDRVAVWKSWDYPTEAVRWAELIPTEKRRHSVYITILRRWLDADEDAAEAWMANSSLPEKILEKARQRPKGWKGRGNRPYPPPPHVGKAR